ncbi:tRNA pseudouridine(55) synthase TruB [Entomobacter blattae]|uniref:tRNA pseudouridine synthase B n=1 Tax=Entomobacter blattae TaxID=2762277 RepID=A0A7H1NPJ2_9PROT|nr:tRNA pseudouridine(55) synthase TruB [Entomobacter blattae]QNT77702.1 tRNA pseudouridine synthase B [Entomobacter blattae]
MRRRRGEDIHGWLVVDKPLNISSAAVVGQLQKYFNAKKVGHGGTLDPLASGLLPIAFGRATKTVPYVMDGLKTYRFTLKMGEARDTDDAEGKVIAVSDKRPSDHDLHKALENFQGTIMQIPPIYSALKVGGKRAYALARAGQELDMVARPAYIDSFKLIERLTADLAVFEVVSGKGVYMRALARDIAKSCGTVGHIVALRRLHIGPFSESHAILLDKILLNEEKEQTLSLLYPVLVALADIPAVSLSDGEVLRLRNGQALNLHLQQDRLLQLSPEKGKVVRAMNGQEVIGLCSLEEGWLKPNRIL